MAKAKRTPAWAKTHNDPVIAKKVQAARAKDTGK